MTTQHPDRPPAKQVNTHGGIGFQDGTHVHNYGGGYPAGAATMASRRATHEGRHLGPPIAKWDPPRLGVHASITVHDETTLTPYLARPHDQDLRQHLTRAKKADRPTFIVVVGTSCTGKTRTLYEAVLDTLPTWPVAAPGSDSGLAKLLLDGIPVNTIVWLDELQDRLTTTHDGITAAKAIRELVDADHLGAIVFAGTIWPANLTTLLSRPDPAHAAHSAGVIQKVLREAALVEVPDNFTDRELDAHADGFLDPRLHVAIVTAGQGEHPEHCRRLTQVLAGGTQVVDRLYPPEGQRTPNTFSPAARAVLLAAADLRRVGISNPIPRGLLEDVTPAYLDPPDHRPPAQWLRAAFDETTENARADDSLTGIRTLDIWNLGLPALMSRWTLTSDGGRSEAYDLHDYLYEDHLIRHRYAPPRAELWEACAEHVHDPEIAQTVAEKAEARGLLTAAINIIRNIADADGHDEVLDIRNRLLATRRAPGDYDELRALADAGDEMVANELATQAASDPLIQLITFPAKAIAELRNRSDHTPGDANELRQRATNGDRRARDALLELLSRRAEGGDITAQGELHSYAADGDYWAQHQMLRLQADQGHRPSVEALPQFRSDLVRRARMRDPRAGAALRRIQIDRVQHLAARGQPADLEELHQRATRGSHYAQEALLELLGRRAEGGDMAALEGIRSLSLGEGHLQRMTIDLLVSIGDIIGLEKHVMAGHYGLDLLAVHRSRGGLAVRELDSNAQPVFEVD